MPALQAGVSQRRGPTTYRRVRFRMAQDAVTPRRRALWVSNSPSGRCRKLDQPAAVGDPTYIAEFGPHDLDSHGGAQRCVASQRRVATCCVVIGLEIDEFAFEVTPVSEQDVVEKFSPYCADQSFHERM